MKYKSGLLSDFASRITHTKEFDGIKYKLFSAVKNVKMAYKMREDLIKAAHGKYSKRIKPVVYDTKWKSDKRFKIYIPEKWDISCLNV